MTDETNSTVSSINIADPNRVQTTFVNQVVGQGFLNGIVNVTFGTFQFSPTVDGKVNPDLVIAARLRMDIVCAQQLHTALGAIIEQALKPTNATTH